VTAVAPVQAFLDAQPSDSLDYLDVAEQRLFMRYLSDLNYLRYGRRADPVESIVDSECGGVPVRVYRPRHERALPVHVFLHGGGWWLGAVDELVNDAMCRYRCLAADCIVVAVEYPLAPEHAFPAAISSVQAVLPGLAQAAAGWGGDPDVVSLGGVSAGANLAAATCLAVRDQGGPRLALQLLEVPLLDVTRWLTPVGGSTRPTDELATAVARYLPDLDQAGLALVSPLSAANLAGLPPTHIMTAELDRLREDGERYADRLSQAGVRVTARRYPDAIHAVSFLTRVWPPALQWQRDAAAVLRVAHARVRAIREDGSGRRRPPRKEGPPSWQTL
jgi:acetyl esterase